MMRTRTGPKDRLNDTSKRSSGRPGGSFLLRRRSVLSWRACAGSIPLRSCVGARALLRACITPGRRTSRVNVYVDGKKRLSGDTERQATSGEVTVLKREMRDLKEVVADLTLENRLLKKSVIGDGEDIE
jgi:hypothetical protein